ncbi:iron-siderophore ABC transporter substrate-binding protein [Psychromicrobium lacuslunae]|uniref:ABC transporter substrate-binding protein n=1 Tax=Psychromicrobium lacuslunae TaxID=1618207 RepID=A0A0D4C0J9_9MICC|nr:iron-siderophore ABC transporter substrate-binding protein [Psychromicrobium lacuslunae]AJT42064.1 ABC transporter substrate-binding protein [Psychromicrobium lacuslunae]
MKISRPRNLAGLGVAALVAALALTSCSTGNVAATDKNSEPSAASDQFPVTLKNVFGETTIKSQPQRVATVSWVNDDTALALGVVPVGMPKVEWGGDAQGLTPWKADALSKLSASLGTEKAPKLYSEADGINFTEIAKTTPDVILAAYSGLSKEDYQKLSKIAPVVAYNGDPYGTSWQDSTTAIGKALGKSQQAQELVTSTEKAIKDEASKFPQLAGKSFVAGNLEPGKADGVNIYTDLDNRPKFLTSLGLKQSSVVQAATKDAKSFFISWSLEKANELDSDVFVSWVPDAGAKDAILKDPLLGQVPAIKKGALVADPDKTLNLAISAASPLSIPWALNKFVPELAAALDAAAK